DSDDNIPATSDFVKKLYKILEDQSFPHIVSCGPNGGCFVVKDMNEFTKSILPRMFKHSNFASFVRQLNKYDFHKVKNADDTQCEALENMKRKALAARVSAPSGFAIGPSALGHSGSARPQGGVLKSLQTQTNTLASHTTNASHAQNATLQSVTTGLQNTLSGFQNGMSGLQPEVAALQSEDRVRDLERCYKDVLGEMVRFQRNIARQGGLMQSLVEYFLRAEGAKHEDSVFATPIASGPAPPTAGLANNSQQIQKPHTPVMPPPTRVRSLEHSMTPNTHPPLSFGMSMKTSTTAAAMSAKLLASQQPQRCPFLQSLTASHSQHMLGSHGHGHGHGPHGPPVTSASSSTLFWALSRSQAQAQAQAQSSPRLHQFHEHKVSARTC
ncbi:HSF-type DNA-binding-domain-containing protein, partial [Pisolithus orientalis]|uniref:HSF-type DNA-binding-domain-containing protein n=1 Tax=Pisolithus orientalis TaxID=936130 RepID=UPI0022258EEB